MEEREILQERLELALLRIREIPGEDFQGAELTTLERIFYNSSEVFTADRGYQTVPGAGETGHCHTGRITAAQPCSV